MSEVTQEDRGAAIKALNEAERQRSFGGNGTVLSNVCQIIAAHRIASDRAGYERGQRETVERIVAWLTNEADDPSYMMRVDLIADAIEAGEWK